MSNLKYRRDIDGLRSLAVVPVVLNHAGIPGVSGGYIGVDIFFVISGFLITSILAREIAENRFSIVGFYERRARRILPALFAVLAVCLIGGFMILPPGLLADLAQSVGATVLFVSNYWFLRVTSDYFAPDAELEPLLHTWSLAVEEQFYIFFPLLLWLVMRRPRSVLISVIVGLSLMSLALSVWLTARAPQANFYMLPSRAWELGLGSMLALGLIPPVRGRGLLIEAVAALGFFGILAACVLYTDATPFPGLTALVPVLGATAIIWAGGQRLTLVGRLLSTRLLVAIGLISYSFYLWHWPVLVWYRIRLGTLDLPMTTAWLAIGIAVVLAAFSWAVIERPFRTRGEKGLGRGAIFAASAAGMLALAGVVGLVQINKGFPSRIPPDVLAIYEAANDDWSRRRVCSGTVDPNEACAIGQKAPPEAARAVLVWGDSHAGALAPGMDSLLEQAGLSGGVAFKSGCAPMIGLVRADMGAAHQCDLFNDQVLDVLAARTDYPVVMLVARWTLVAEGTRAEGEGGTVPVLAASDPDGPYREAKGNFALFEAALAHTVETLRATGREVVILRSIPEIGWNVPRVLGNSRFIGAPTPEVPMIDDIRARNARTDAVLSQLDKQPGVTVLSALEAICTPACQIERDGRPLYRDDDHLSRFGARTLLPDVLRPVLDLMPPTGGAADNGPVSR